MKYAAAFGALAAAVHASPFPAAVTSDVSPSAAAPSGCSASYSGSFGIAVQTIASTSSTASNGTTPYAYNAKAYATPTPSVAGYVVSQISDGQIQAATSAAAQTLVAVSQIGDGQIQAQATTSSASSSTSSDVASTVAVVSEISDGQPQAPATTASSSSSTSSTSSVEATTTADAVSQISDGQIQAPTTSTTLTTVTSSSSSTSAEATTTAAAVTQISDGQIQSPGSKRSLVACATNSTLTLTLSDGVLTDSSNRTGYIASNYQFQFDDPPQDGAIYTAGFSVCSNGSLALGGSAVWYRCLSGSFYNLYDRYWAEQCEAVTISVVELEQCS